LLIGIDDDSMGVCPVCNKSFFIDVLEEHINEELAQWNDDVNGDDEDAALSDDINTTEHADTTSAINNLNGLHDFDESIFISDDENDWFGDRPSGIEILSQPPPVNTSTTAITTSTICNNTHATTVQPVSVNQISGRLSPLQGLLNLHEARHRYPELEGYFNQFKIDDDSSSSMMMLDTNTSTTIRYHNNNNNNNNQRQKTSGTRIRPVQVR
jgi:hypothetical protein